MTRKRPGRAGPPSVPDAPAPTPSTETGLKHGEKRTNPKTWPKYTEPEQRLILEFLMAYGMAAQMAVDKAREMDEAAPGNHVIAGTIRYWQNVVSGIDWMIGKVSQRQRAVQLLRDELARREAP